MFLMHRHQSAIAPELFVKSMHICAIMQQFMHKFKELINTYKHFRSLNSIDREPKTWNWLRNASDVLSERCRDDGWMVGGIDTST